MPSLPLTPPPFDSLTWSGTRTDLPMFSFVVDIGRSVRIPGQVHRGSRFLVEGRGARDGYGFRPADAETPRRSRLTRWWRIRFVTRLGGATGTPPGMPSSAAPATADLWHQALLGAPAAHRPGRTAPRCSRPGGAPFGRGARRRR